MTRHRRFDRPEGDKAAHVICSYGLLGEMHKGQMQPELEEVAFSLQKGEVSKPVRSRAGVHILKVDDRQEEGKEAPLDDVKDKIKERLYAQAIESRFQQWLEKDLKSGHSIVIRQ